MTNDEEASGWGWEEEEEGRVGEGGVRRGGRGGKAKKEGGEAERT